MASAGVVGYEVEQHPHATAVSGLHELDQRRVPAVARLDVEEVLMVVAVMRRTAVHRAEPQHVAAETCDVIQVLADAIQRAAVQRGGVAGRRQALARAREAVDHDVVADRVADPVRRRRRGGFERKLLAARPRIGVGGPDRGFVLGALVNADPVAARLARIGVRHRAGPTSWLTRPFRRRLERHRLAAGNLNRYRLNVEIRSDLGHDSLLVAWLRHARMEGAPVKRACTARVLRGRLVLEESVVSASDRRHQRVDREHQQRMRAKIDAAADEEQPLRRALDHRGMECGDRGRAPSLDRVLPRAPEGRARACGRRFGRLAADPHFQLGQAIAQTGVVRPAQVLFQAPGQLRILAPLDAERPLEEGTRRTAFAADVERISQQDVLPRPRNKRTRPVVVLRDREDAAPVERRDGGAIRQLWHASDNRRASGAAKRRRVESIRPSITGPHARLRQDVFQSSLPGDMRLTFDAERKEQALVNRREAPLDPGSARVSRHHPQHVGAAHVLEVVLPAASAEAAPPGRGRHHGMDWPFDELLVEMRRAQADKAAVATDPGEEAAVADGGREACAHEVGERLRRARFITAAIRRGPAAFSISSIASGSASFQFGNSVVVPGTLGRSLTPSASSSDASTMRDFVRARAR